MNMNEKTPLDIKKIELWRDKITFQKKKNNLKGVEPGSWLFRLIWGKKCFVLE